MLDMISTAFVAPLMPSIRESMSGSLFALAAGIAAVDLSSIVGAADEERPRTVAAAQLEDIEVVHPSRRDENLTTASGPTTVRTYWLSIRRLYTRIQAPTWVLFRFIRRSDLH